VIARDDFICLAPGSQTDKVNVQKAVRDVVEIEVAHELIVAAFARSGEITKANA
jgi:hypothetical protein